MDGEPGKGEDGGDQEPCVAFSSDVVSDQQTESDMKQLETKHKMSLQQIKEQVVGSVRPLTSSMLYEGPLTLLILNER